MAYIPRTNYPFMLRELIAISSLVVLGFAYKDIQMKVFEEDIFSLRSKASRKSALRAAWRDLDDINIDYIKLIANGNQQIARLTVFFLLIRQNQLLQDVMKELIFEKIRGYEHVVSSSDFRVFFESKRSQVQDIRNWSESTYHKACSNTILTLVKAEYLYPIQPNKVYEIKIQPIPQELRNLLLADGSKLYLNLMLDIA